MPDLEKENTKTIVDLNIKGDDEAALEKIAKILLDSNNIYILTHRNPDGDTLGSGYALCLALQKLGKNAKVLNSDNIPKKFLFIKEYVKEQEFEPSLILSVDVADTSLLGNKLSVYKDNIDISIDHHKSRVEFSPISYVEPTSAATTEIIYILLNKMNIEITKDIANCLYVGLATDTGCFRFDNTTVRSFLIASSLMYLGAECAEINTTMFDTKSKKRVELERVVLQNIKFYYGGKVAFVYYTKDMLKKIGAVYDDTTEIVSMPNQIEGVIIGVTIREDDEKSGYKVSLRGNDSVDVSKICETFNGGGHRSAAGAFIPKSFDEVRKMIIAEIGKQLNLY